ncbi:SusC/RagA family TonB-linked outer membrane protein [Larkinella soli]|uniref:SusC/RagA family TonB-linked outer membrane protein n=1 Tax=Larkinella soli TaxID=1770527 RepID=UPI001E2F9241|nr:TonB-dependent receptor [Larkinella soli]
MLTLIAFLLGLQLASAQGRTITGTVTAEDKKVLPGATVQVKGTNRGTATDGDGRYSLSGVPENATLVFSFIGMESREEKVNDRPTIDVVLMTDTKQISEVVVIGYGTQKAKDVTGGIVAVSPKDFNQGVIASPEQLLQGRAAGVQITPASGEPGSGVNIQIRGTASLRSGNNPLFVIDGVPLDGGDVSSGGVDFGGGVTSARNPLTFLNPNDIENISVLKDASAAAIYGSRGANGVVLITTRKGKAGQPALNFSASTSVSSALKRYDLLNRDEFLAGVKKAGGDASAIDKGANTDWQDQILRTGVSQNYNLGFGGGNAATRYYFSLGYADQQGIVRNSAMQRLSGRINASHKLFNERVTLEANVTTSGIKDSYVLNGNDAGYQGNLIGAAIQANPTYPVMQGDTAYFQPGGDFRNPAAILAYDNDKGMTNRTLANASVSWKIIDGLTAKANFGLDNSSAVRRTALDSRLNAGFSLNTSSNTTFSVYGNGLAIIQNRYRNSRLLEYTLNYNHKVGSGQLDALAGFSYQKFQNQGHFINASFFSTTQDRINYLDNIGAVNAAKQAAFAGGSDHSRNDLQSFFGRVNYDINDKYLLTATLRVDGSSRFGLNNKYGSFPSVAAAWRLSNEDFIPKKVFDDLKLRLNYGITGNQDFEGGASKIIFQLNSDGSTVQKNNPNPDIKWEETVAYGAGLDFSILKGKLAGTVDYFYKSTTNQLFQVFYAQPAPVTYKWVNLPGHINNTGVELSLSYQAIQRARFNWEVLYNMTFLKNKVTDFGSTVVPTGTIHGQGLSGAYAQVIRDGYPIFSFVMPTFTGFNENGIATYADGGRSAIHGSPIPKVRLGLTNNFTFGNWSASLFFNGQFGGYIYNNTANALFLKGILKNGRNVTKEVADNAENPLNPGSVSTRFLEKSDFVRLSNATLSYRVPMPAQSFAKSLSIALTGQNLLLFSDYTGLDPEVNTVKVYNNIPSLGIDYTAFPTARTFTLGVNVGF